MKNLEAKIRYYNDEYRKGTPHISDAEYDSLIEELKIINPNSDILKSGVVEKPKTSRKEALPIPMFSLNKVKTISEIFSWLKSINISDDELLVITPKYDGISLCVDDFNEECWTRGNGEIGQRSDYHYSRLNNNSYDLPDSTGFSFGEAIMKKNNFVNKYKDEFANARNLVAGLFNRDVAKKSLNDVDYVRYGIESELTKDFSKHQQLDFLNLRLNKVPVPYLITKASELTVEFLDSIYESFSEDYQIDGLVIDIDNSNVRKNLGREENNNPKYSRAYKNPDWSNNAISEVIDIVWGVSKQGNLKPVIKIKPIEIGGVVISNVTGYNVKYVSDNNIAKGSIIKITRSGDVIPKHLETQAFIIENVYSMLENIKYCPICGSEVKMNQTGVEAICENINCEGIQISKLVHFFKVLKVEDFGEPSIKTFYDSGFKTHDAILNMSIDDIIKIGGWAKRSAEKLLNQFQNLKTHGVSFSKLLHALDLMEGKIGEKTIQLILDNYDLSEGVDTFSVSELLKIKGIAKITAETYYFGIQKFFSKYNQLKFSPVKISSFKSKKETININGKYLGVKACFTGVRPTKNQELMFIKEGGEILSGVSKNTTHLIVKDLSNKTLSSSKSKKALSLGVKIIPINEFFI